MKKENDEITDLFRTRLADAGMSVRDGFWEELSQEIPVACQHRRRILLFRVAAAASVLLVLAASSATFLYFSPKEEMEEAFTKIAVTNGGQMDGDGIRVNQLPLPVEPVLPKPAPKSYGMLSQYTEEEDSLSITFSMSAPAVLLASGSSTKPWQQKSMPYLSNIPALLKLSATISPTVMRL